MKDWVSCDGNWLPLSDKIVSGTPYLLKNGLKTFMHFPASQEHTNSEHIALEGAQVKIKIQALYIFWES